MIKMILWKHPRDSKLIKVNKYSSWLFDVLTFANAFSLLYSMFYVHALLVDTKAIWQDAVSDYIDKVIRSSRLENLSSFRHQTLREKDV